MINQKEIKQLVSFIKKLENPHEGLPKPVFDALVGIVPFIACEIVVISEKGVLLKWRDDKLWRGWHFPGGLLRFGETFDERIAKTVWDELEINIESHKFLFINDYRPGVRGHTISLVFLCKTEMTPKNGKFFKKMPKNIIEEHKEFWKKIEKIK